MLVAQRKVLDTMGVDLAVFWHLGGFSMASSVIMYHRRPVQSWRSLTIARSDLFHLHASLGVAGFQQQTGNVVRRSRRL